MYFYFRFDYDDPWLNEMFTEFRTATDIVGAGFASDMSPWFKFLDRKKIAVVEQWSEKFLVKISEEFDGHKKTFDPSKSKLATTLI